MVSQISRSLPSPRNSKSTRNEDGEFYEGPALKITQSQYIEELQDLISGIRAENIRTT